MYSAMQSKILVLGTCYCYVGPTASHAEEWVQYRVLVLGPWSPVLGPRSPVPGPRSPVPGPRSPVPGPRSLVPGPWSSGPLFRPSPGNQPIPEWYHSPGILGNSTLSVLLMECGLFCLHPVLSKLPLPRSKLPLPR